MDTKKIQIEMLDCTGLRIRKCNIDVPLNFETKIVSYEEFNNYKTTYKNNKSCKADIIIYTQDFSRNCNGFSKYFLGRFKRVIIDNESKEWRTLTVGEAWSLGDNID